MEKENIRDKIFASDDMGCEEVKVPEWGVTVYMRGLNGEERDEFEAKFVDANEEDKLDLRGQKAKMVLACSMDADRKPIFKPNDVNRLLKKSGLVLDRLFEVCSRLSGLSDTATAETAEN